MKPLVSKHILMVIAKNNFRDEEFKIPKVMLEEQGAEVTIASSDMAIARGKLGMKVMPDNLLDEVSARDFDAVVFVGGGGAGEYFHDVNAHKLAQDAVKFNKVIGAICIAPAILANAGVLKDRKATIFPSDVEELKANGAKYTGTDIEQDGQIITASGPEVAKQFGQAIIQALGK